VIVGFEVAFDIVDRQFVLKLDPFFTAAPTSAYLATIVPAA